MKAKSHMVAIFLMIIVNVLAQEEELPIEGRGVLIVKHDDSEETFAEIQKKIYVSSMQFQKEDTEGDRVILH